MLTHTQRRSTAHGDAAVDAASEARLRVEAALQAMVDVGIAHWHLREDEYAELRLGSGEIFSLGRDGVTRLR